MTRRKPAAVLVTGGAGYIGSHACKALAAAGYVPVTYDNLSCGHRWAVKWGPFVEADVGDEMCLRETIHAWSIRAVLHFAGSAYVGESMRDPGKYFRNNSANTLTLLEAMRDTGADRIVFSSTCAVYGLPAEVPLSEETSLSPVSPYGESKLSVERMLEWWGRVHALRWMALRYFNAAGADPAGELGEDHTPETRLVPLAIQAALGRRSHVDVYGTDYPTRDGTAIRDYIHVSDLAAAHVYALAKLEAGASNGAMNLGTGQGHSVREVIAMVERVGGRPVPARDRPRREGDPPELVARAVLARENLGWVTAHSSLQTIVETAWRWHATRARPAAAGAAPGRSQARADAPH